MSSRGAIVVLRRSRRHPVWQIDVAGSSQLVHLLQGIKQSARGRPWHPGMGDSIAAARRAEYAVLKTLPVRELAEAAGLSFDSAA